MRSRDKILELIYHEPGILITDLIKCSKTSVKSAMQIISSLSRENVIKEDVLRRGKKTITRRIYPSLNTEAGKATFSLVELSKREQFYEDHPELRGPLTQLAENISADIILVFGSFARGGESKASDVDLLILSKQFDKKLVEREAEISFSTVNNRPSIRIQKLGEFKKNLSSAFYQTILRDHVIIKGAAEFIKLIAKSHKMEFEL